MPNTGITGGPWAPACRSWAASTSPRLRSTVRDSLTARAWLLAEQRSSFCRHAAASAGVESAFSTAAVPRVRPSEGRRSYAGDGITGREETAERSRTARRRTGRRHVPGDSPSMSGRGDRTLLMPTTASPRSRRQSFSPGSSPSSTLSYADDGITKKRELSGRPKSTARRGPAASACVEEGGAEAARPEVRPDRRADGLDGDALGRHGARDPRDDLVAERGDLR